MYLPFLKSFVRTQVSIDEMVRLDSVILHGKKYHARRNQKITNRGNIVDATNLSAAKLVVIEWNYSVPLSPLTTKHSRN